MKGLMDNRHILDLIANELLENSRITGLVSFTCYILHIINRLVEIRSFYILKFDSMISGS